MNASNDDEFNAVQNTIQAEIDARNRQGLDVFSGLSPMQMSAILYKPFDSPDVLTFPKTVEGADAPILSLFLLLVDGIGEKGAKLTATGNLPRNLCREVAQIHLGEDGYLKCTEFGGINKETDFYDLHIVRLAAGLAKLTRKYKGKILLTNKATIQQDRNRLFITIKADTAAYSSSPNKATLCVIDNFNDEIIELVTYE